MIKIDSESPQSGVAQKILMHVDLEFKDGQVVSVKPSGLYDYEFSYEPRTDVWGHVCEPAKR